MRFAPLKNIEKLQNSSSIFFNELGEHHRNICIAAIRLLVIGSNQNWLLEPLMLVSWLLIKSRP